MTLPARHLVRTLPAVAATAVAAVLLAVSPAWAQSYYTIRLDDPKAVYLDAMGARGDGVADDTAAIRGAIDRVQETVGQGVVFVREGRYRITKTINVWPAVRLIGYGAKRPVLVLADNTPGYGYPAAENYMVFFAGSRPGAGGRGAQAGAAAPAAPGGGRGAQASAPAGTRPPDASPGTFYSAMSNIDIEIGAGNAGAVGLAAAKPGEPFYVSSESEVTTWRGVLGPDGNFTDFKVFAQQGGEGVAVDASGRVYLAAGQIYVYSPQGQLIETIDTPERPTQIAFGGKDGRTLFICARSSLYAVRVKTPGR